mmetsp:Transcript_4109/g.9817  ORF Transcript_4109/g.9817 Transcript_4109/m.9817 type:complete len:204 (+) Transcript_4109:29-640(+)
MGAAPDYERRGPVSSAEPTDPSRRGSAFEEGRDGGDDVEGGSAALEEGADSPRASNLSDARRWRMDVRRSKAADAPGLNSRTWARRLERVSALTPLRPAERRVARSCSEKGAASFPSSRAVSSASRSASETSMNDPTRPATCAGSSQGKRMAAGPSRLASSACRCSVQVAARATGLFSMASRTLSRTPASSSRANSSNTISWT